MGMTLNEGVMTASTDAVILEAIRALDNHVQSLNGGVDRPTKSSERIEKSSRKLEALTFGLIAFTAILVFVELIKWAGIIP